MATETISRARSGAHASWDVADLWLEVRHRRFDLGRCLHVTYAVETGHRRETAFELRQRAAYDGWQSSLYADASGLVVRLGRSERVTRDLLATEQRYLDSLAETYGATIRAVSIEDLGADDTWARLAAGGSGEPIVTVAAQAPVGDEHGRTDTLPLAEASIA